MTTPRRRVIRSAAGVTGTDPSSQAAQRRADAKLTQARLALKRWMPRLKRALNAVAKQYQQIARLEKQVATLARR